VLRTRAMRYPLHLIALSLSLFGAACVNDSDSLLYRGGGGGDFAPEYDAEDPLGDDDDNDDDAGTGESVGGGPEILNLDPSPEASSHHYRAPLFVAFTAEASGTNIAVYDDEGVLLPTDENWSSDGNRVWITPQPRLEPDSQYSVEIELGTQLLVFDFRTSTIGLLDDGVDLTGAVFSMDLSTITVESPAGLGPIQDPLSPRVPLLQLGDIVYGETNLTFGLGVDEAGSYAQDLCTRAGQVMADGDVTLSQALVDADVELLSFQVGDATIEVEQAVLQFDVLPAGNGLTELNLSGYVRATSLNTLLGTDASCELIAGSSTGACEPCLLGDGECIWTELSGISGERVDLNLDIAVTPESDGCPEDAVAPFGCSAQGDGAASLIALLFSTLLVGYRRRSA